ncbi:FAD:protein FMN transferase [Cumulibacter manganitolerans]|uniref:FAD:protein FMN transferase n=1 Tax=Cumulibacter manganitolerans TaxID=1884992 RepID=UPI001295336B|nr:FAD:protein FMN transferase [Cumulibacter manganitolerans]
MSARSGVGRWELQLWTTYGVILTTDPRAIDRVRDDVLAELDRIERACSRFRADSEVCQIVRRPGVPIVLSDTLAALMDRAQRSLEWTGGAVSVTLGTPLGYDPLVGVYTARPREVLDFGSIGKAYAAERVAALIAERTGSGVLVNLGGDIATVGAPPEGGWRIRIDDDSSPESPVVALGSGGLATSSIVRRAWSDADGTRRHHIIDPRTGENPPPYWLTVSVVADSAVDANAAATAAIVLGERGPDLLERHGLSARLVGVGGSVRYLGSWPHDRLTHVA